MVALRCSYGGGGGGLDGGGEHHRHWGQAKGNGDTAGEMTGLPSIVVVVVGVVNVAATGEPVERTEVDGVPP